MRRNAFNIVLIMLLATTALSAQSYYEQIRAYDQLEDIDEAISKLHLLTKKARAAGLPDTVAVIQLELASYFFYYAISFDSAIHYCDQALSTIQENIEGYKIPYLKAWYEKGFYYRKWDKFDLSKEALQVVLDEEENEYTFRATWQMGKLYKDRGEFSLAFKHYQEALELAGDDMKKKINVYEYISFAYSIMGTEEGARNAIYWLDKLEAGVKSLPDNSQDDYLPLVAYNKGECYYQLGELDKAIELVDEAAELLEACCDDPDFEGLIADFKGYMEYEKGNYAKAIEYYKKGIKLFQYSYDLGRGEGLAGNYRSMAEAYLKWGRLDSALIYADKAIIDRTYGFDNNLKPRKFPKKNELLTNGEKAYLLEDLMLKGDVYEKLHHHHGISLDSTLHYYELAEQVLDAMSYDHVEENTKIFWRQTAKNVYYHLIRLYLIHGRTDLAFILSEKSKYVILEEHLRKTELSKKTISLPLVKEYQRLLDSIRIEETRQQNSSISLFSNRRDEGYLIKLRSREDDLLENIRDKHPSIYESIFSWRAPDIQSLQKKLRRDQSIFIEYFLHDSMSYAFVLDGTQIHAKPLLTREDLTVKVKDFLSKFTPEKAQIVEAIEYNDDAFDLFINLLDTSYLSEKTEIIITPDDVLSLLPFDVLTTTSVAPSNDYNTLNYLIKSQAIRYVINGKALYEQENDSDSKRKDEVVSFVPSFGDRFSEHLATDHILRDDLTPLTGAAKEVESLCSLFSCKAFSTQVGERLFYDQVERKNKIIHIATHARMNDSVPGFSHLIMESTQDSIYDDFIHVFELKNKRIKSDLVVLSACNTGAGKIYRGEGLASLGIAFHYAGSPNLITSLWSIPDHSSSIIMQQFYEKLTGNTPKHLALRDAKLFYLNDYITDIKHPFYWGGFLYYGNSLPLDVLTEPTGLSLYIYIFMSFVLFFGIRIAYQKYQQRVKINS